MKFLEEITLLNMRKFDKKDISLVLEGNTLPSDRSYTLGGLTTRRDYQFDNDFFSFHTARTNEENETFRDRKKDAVSNQTSHIRRQQEEKVNIYSSFERNKSDVSRRSSKDKSELPAPHTTNTSTIFPNNCGLDSKSRERKYRHKNVLSNITNFNSKDNTEDSSVENINFAGTFKSLSITNKSPRFYSNNYEDLAAKLQENNELGDKSKKSSSIKKHSVDSEENFQHTRKTKSISDIHYESHVERNTEARSVQSNLQKKESEAKLDAGKSHANDIKDSTQKPQAEDPTSILIEYEKEKNLKLEEKLASKEKLIDEMRKFHEEVTSCYQEAEKNFNNIIMEKDKTINEFIEEKIKLSERINELEKVNLGLNKDVQNLQNTLKQKVSMIAELRQENTKLKFEAENSAGANQSLQKLTMRVKSLEDENMQLKIKLENQQDAIAYNYEDKIRRLQREVDRLRKENEGLRAAQNETSRDSGSERSENSDILVSKSFSTTFLQKKYGTLNPNELRSLDFKRDILSPEVRSRKEFDEDKMIELLEYKKNTQKFLDKLTNLILELSPPKHFSHAPSLKDIWKWLQNLLKEYMNLKKKSASYEETEDILRDAMEMVNADRKSDFLGSLSNILNQLEKLKQITSKVRVWLDNSRIKELDELERRLDKQTQKK